jgi:hypothetical protein
VREFQKNAPQHLLISRYLQIRGFKKIQCLDTIYKEISNAKFLFFNTAKQNFYFHFLLNFEMHSNVRGGIDKFLAWCKRIAIYFQNNRYYFTQRNQPYT